MTTDQAAPPADSPPQPRNRTTHWTNLRTRRTEGRPLESLDDVLGPFTPRFQARVLTPLATLKEQYLEGQRYLTPDDWRLVKERIEEAVRTARALADELPRPVDGGIDPVEAHLTARVTECAAEIKSRAQRRVQREYFKGTLFGVAASIGLLVVLYALIIVVFELAFDGLHGPNKVLVAHSLVAIGGGAGGATLSSLIRLRRQEVEDHHASGIRAATIRIMLGWFFAAAILFLVKGEVVNVFKAPDSPLAMWFYWGGLGFLGGFNEAWVTDLVTKKSSDGVKDIAKDIAKKVVDRVKR